MVANNIYRNEDTSKEWSANLTKVKENWYWEFLTKDSVHHVIEEAYEHLSTQDLGLVISGRELTSIFERHSPDYFFTRRGKQIKVARIIEEANSSENIRNIYVVNKKILKDYIKDTAGLYKHFANLERVLHYKMNQAQKEYLVEYNLDTYKLFLLSEFNKLGKTTFRRQSKDPQVFNENAKLVKAYLKEADFKIYLFVKQLRKIIRTIKKDDILIWDRDN